MTCTSPIFTFYNSQCGTNGKSSFVTDGRSFRLFIRGFLTKIQNASNAFLAEISDSCASMVHLIKQSFSCAY